VRALTIVATIFAAGYLALLLANRCDFAAGPDSSGYLNQARLLQSGSLSVEVDGDPSLIHLFTPYGFRAGVEPGTMVPTYPVGTSLHLLAGALLGGWTHGPFLVVPLFAAGSLFLLFFVARRLGLTTGSAIACAALLAAFPIFISQAVQPVSDVLAVFWALAAIACALRSDEHWRWAVACGLAFAIGVAVRPTNLLLAIPLLIAMRFRWRRMAIAAAAVLPLALALAWYQNALYGSPFTTGYPSGLLSFAAKPPCLTKHVTWLISMATPILFPGGLFVAFHRRMEAWHRALLLSWFAVFFGFYAYYGFCPDHASTRFLLPALPPLILGFVSLASHVRILAVIVVIAVLTREVVQIGRLHVLQLDEWEAIYPRTVAAVDRIAPPDAVVLAAVTSGAFQFHSTRRIVRWDQLTPEITALLRADAKFAGPWFAAVSEVEGGLSALRSHAPGEWRAVQQIRDVTIWRLDR
jgi:4-amino-4-deoxy-L-arabinose transferase-like glycosyltransferase